MDPAITSFKITGLCSAPFTPMHADGSIDYASLDLHFAELLAQGVTSAFVNGTTGEGYTLSLAERKALLERWVTLSKGRIAIIAMVGAEALPDMLELATHAHDAGANAVSYQPSTFFKPDGVGSIVGLMGLVAEAARGLPLYYYHIAIKTGVTIRCDLLLDAVAAAQAAGTLRTFRGIKYSDADLHILSNCIHGHGGAFDVAYGKDEQMLGALAMGAKGFVGSTYNYSGRVSNEVIALWAKGAFAVCVCVCVCVCGAYTYVPRAVCSPYPPHHRPPTLPAGDTAGALAKHRLLQKLVNLLYNASAYGPGSCNVGKAVMQWRLRTTAGKPDAVSCGPPRAPGTGVTAEGMQKLRADLQAIGFFDY